MLNIFARLGRTSEAAAAVEYALLLVGVAAVIVGVVTQIGPKLLPGFQTVIDGLP
jgi:Flp pilus assembly pilin Flp